MCDCVVVEWSVTVFHAYIGHYITLQPVAGQRMQSQSAGVSCESGAAAG